MYERHSNSFLVDNLFQYNEQLFTHHITPVTKELLVKDGISGILREIVTKLNEKYSDVRFSIRWLVGNPAEKMVDENYCVGGFNEHQCSDTHNIDEEDDERTDTLYENNFESLTLKLMFDRAQKCNFGHTHVTKRFYYYSMPKIIELTGFYSLSPLAINEIVSRYIPNFFE